MAQQQLSEQERSMTEANFNQEQFQQQLERMKSLYQQLIMQQKLEAAAKQAQELAEQQKQLMDSLDASPQQKIRRIPPNLRIQNNLRYLMIHSLRKVNKGPIHWNNRNSMNLLKEKIVLKQESDKLSEKLDTLGNEMSDIAKSQENSAPQIEKVADEVMRLNQYTKDQKII